MCGKLTLYIPIWFYSNGDCLSSIARKLTFTFQSASIQMLPTAIMDKIHNGFTFQSGSIQIVLDVNNTSLNKNFTFQSGSIQIKSPCIRLVVQ